MLPLGPHFMTSGLVLDYTVYSGPFLFLLALLCGRTSFWRLQCSVGSQPCCVRGYGRGAVLDWEKQYHITLLVFSSHTHPPTHPFSTPYPYSSPLLMLPNDKYATGRNVLFKNHHFWLPVLRGQEKNYGMRKLTSRCITLKCTGKTDY